MARFAAAGTALVVVALGAVALFGPLGTGPGGDAGGDPDADADRESVTHADPDARDRRSR